MTESHPPSIRRHGRSPLAAALATALAIVAHAGPLAAQQDRIRVAVLNFDTYLVEQAEWQFPWAASGLGPLATSMLTSELASQRRFTVIERRYIDEILAEQDFGDGARVNPSTAAQMGQLLGAQVVVVGDVEEFGTKKMGGIGGLARGIVGGSQETMSVVLGARLIDAGTGEILSTSEGSADVSQGALGLLTSSVGVVVGSELEGEASKVMRQAIEDLATNIAEEADSFELAPIITCLTGSVATVAGGRVYLTLGASTSIAVGDYFEIRDRQQAILDPVTGDTLGFVESAQGLVQVAEVQDRMSIADVVEGGGFAQGHAAARAVAPGGDGQCVNVPGSNPAPSAPSAVPQPSGAGATAAVVAGPGSGDAQAGGARPVAVAADAGATRPRYEPPSASDDSPIGDWHLDGEETIRFWVRTFATLSPIYASVTEAQWRESMGDGYLQWRDGIDSMAMRLSIREDGTFHIELRDPATETRSTVDGTWRPEGLLYALSGTHVDGIEVASVRDEHIKVGGGRVFGQNPDLSQSSALTGLYGGWQLRWPNLSGGAFLRVAS